MDFGELRSLDFNQMMKNDVLFIAQKSGEKNIYKVGKSALYWALNDHLNGFPFRRNVYREANLGTAVTDEQWEEIRNGTFRNMFIGDYWVIGGMKYFIADFNYFINVGDGSVVDGTRVSENHIVIVPQGFLTESEYTMNDSSSSETGYIGSKMRTTTIPERIRPIIDANFGSEHILKARRPFSNSVNSNGEITGYAWTDSYVDLLSVGMVFGNFHDKFSRHGDLVQLALYSMNHRLAFQAFVPLWLSDTGFRGGEFLYVSGNGLTVGSDVANSKYKRLRPVFAIKG